MRVEFYGMLRLISGLPTVDFDLPEAGTLRGLLAGIAARYPEMRPHLLDEAGNLPSQTPVFVDGRNPRLASGGLDARLTPASVVSLFSPIASGKLNVEGLRLAARPTQEAGE